EKLDFTLAQLSDDWRLSFELGGHLDAGARVRLLPPADIHVLPPQGQVEGNIGVALVGQATDPTQPFIIFGQTGSSRLQALKVRLAAGATLKWDVVDKVAKASGAFEIVVEQGKLVIDTSDSDGFIQKLLSGVHLEANFPFTATWN